MYLLVIFTSSFENSLFNSCAHFFTGLLILWGLSFLSSLKIIDIIPYWMSIQKRFSLILWAVLSLVTVSFAVQKLFSLMQSHLFIISLRCWAFWVLFGKLFPIPSVPVYFLLHLRVVSKFQALC
jgi:hypothetical protein